MSENRVCGICKKILQKSTQSNKVMMSNTTCCNKEIMYHVRCITTNMTSIFNLPSDTSIEQWEHNKTVERLCSSCEQKCFICNKQHTKGNAGSVRKKCQKCNKHWCFCIEKCIENSQEKYVCGKCNESSQSRITNFMKPRNETEKSGKRKKSEEENEQKEQNEQKEATESIEANEEEGKMEEEEQKEQKEQKEQEPSESIQGNEEEGKMEDKKEQKKQEQKEPSESIEGKEEEGKMEDKEEGEPTDISTNLTQETMGTSTSQFDAYTKGDTLWLISPSPKLPELVKFIQFHPNNPDVYKSTKHPGFYAVQLKEGQVEMVVTDAVEPYYENEDPSRQHYTFVPPTDNDDKRKEKEEVKSDSDTDTEESDTNSVEVPFEDDDEIIDAEIQNKSNGVFIIVPVVPKKKKVWYITEYNIIPQWVTIKKMLKNVEYVINNGVEDINVTGFHLLNGDSDIEPRFKSRFEIERLFEETPKYSIKYFHLPDHYLLEKNFLNPPPNL